MPVVESLYGNAHIIDETGRIDGVRYDEPTHRQEASLKQQFAELAAFREEPLLKQRARNAQSDTPRYPQPVSPAGRNVFWLARRGRYA